MTICWKILLLLQLIVIGLLEIYLILKYAAVSHKLRKIRWQSSGDKKRTLP